MELNLISYFVYLQKYRAQEEMVYIIRKDPLVIDHARSEQSAMKTKAPIVPNEVKTLVPEHMVPAETRKRRTQNSESNSVCSAKDSLPMEQRLSALNLDKATDTIAPPQADNLIHLLRQVVSIIPFKLILNLNEHFCCLFLF